MAYLLVFTPSLLVFIPAVSCVNLLVVMNSTLHINPIKSSWRVTGFKKTISYQGGRELVLSRVLSGQFSLLFQSLKKTGQSKTILLIAKHEKNNLLNN